MDIMLMLISLENPLANVLSVVNLGILRVPVRRKRRVRLKRKLIMLRMIVAQSLALLTVLLVMILIATLIYVMV